MHFRILSWLLPLGLVFLVAGCTTGKKLNYQKAEVSGKVLFKNKPVSGGKVTFVADVGGLGGSAVIDEDGNYKLMAPVGPVHITVDNSMLTKQRGPTRGHVLRPPGSEEPDSVKGTYVPFPKKYYTVEKTDLTFTVELDGPQIHDIILLE